MVFLFFQLVFLYLNLSCIAIGYYGFHPIILYIITLLEKIIYLGHNELIYLFSINSLPLQ